jgi:putative ABC transport system ATP-binding protein
VTEVKPQLRLLLKETGRGTAGVSPIELMHPIIEVKAMAGALTQYAAQFDDIPSFTTLSDGIAFESVENETYTKSDEEAMLEAARLFKMYRRGGSTVYALRGVDLAVKEGEFLIIEGSSGSGKTTLLNMLAGLDNPDRGAVFFEEDNLTDLKDRKKAKARRENFSFIFQSYALIPHLDGTENVALPIDMGGLSSDLKKQIQGLLDDVGIGEYADHKPAYLSGGQMQRLGIARALANRPRVIFADEPTGDLDEETGRKVMDLLKKYHEETGVTIVLVTHNPELAEEYATRRIRVEDGQVV